MRAVSGPAIPPQAADTLDFLIRLGGSVAALWVTVSKIWKPYIVWRRDHLAKVIREVLKPELEQLARQATREERCSDSMEKAIETMHEVFRDLDGYHVLAMDNRDRLDETNELLDQIFSLDRRVDWERKQEIDSLLVILKERAKARRRHIPTEPITRPIEKKVEERHEGMAE